MTVELSSERGATESKLFAAEGIGGIGDARTGTADVVAPKITRAASAEI